MSFDEFQVAVIPHDYPSRPDSVQPTTSTPLCDFCAASDFEAVGFRKPNYPASVKSKQRKVADVLHTAQTCVLCSQIASFCKGWKSNKRGILSPSELEEAVIYFDLFQVNSQASTVSRSATASLLYLRVGLTLENPEPLGGFCGGEALFQRCASVPKTVADFVEEKLTTSSHSANASFGRRRPPEIDPRLVRKWKTLCDQWHPESCRISKDSTVSYLRLVDVHRRCIVNGSGDDSYVALSYVWGDQTAPCLTKRTSSMFSQEGSIDAQCVPATILDAMTTTSALGERYLWVDSCCIIQDDEADKLQFVPHMDTIYSNAIVTIIAASGNDAESGLPGMRVGSRHQNQTTFHINGINFMQTLDPVDTENCNSYIGESTWNQRGWTFQERLMSKRCLVFTAEQVYWECNGAHWSEDSSREFQDMPIIYRHCLDDTMFREPLNGNLSYLDDLYCQLVERYSTRSFRHEEDYYHGFRGIVNAFSRMNASNLVPELPFLWHLPVSHFSTALAWPANTHPNYLTGRRMGLHILSEDSQSRCRLPSWSWVGWYGQVEWSDGGEPLTPWSDSGIQFYTLSEEGEFLRLPEPDYSSLEKDGAAWLGTQRLPSRDHIPDPFPPGTAAINALCFWSSTAEVDVPPKRHYPSTMYHPKSTWQVDFTWKHLADNIRSPHETFLAVVIGFTAGKRALNVLLVQVDEGIAYRRGLVTLAEDWWVQLDPTWRQITLC